MDRYYCGNNRLHRDLLNNTKILGTRYKCLQIGIGKGTNLSFDPDYLGDYEPIDNTTIYCGNDNDLPQNYDKFGNISECLRKGIGIGKRQRALAEQNNDDGGDINYIQNTCHFTLQKIIFYFTFEIVLFLILFFFTPSILLDEDEDHENKKQINIYKFLSFYILLSIIFCLIICNIEIFYKL
jgi:hypothetical protein